MIVYDVECAAKHRFEGWFADAEAFATQRAAGQIACPYCDSTEVERALSVPRIAGTGDGTLPASVIERLASLQKDMLKDSQWVGDTFATRARAMAEGDEPQSTIHGSTTLGQARELVEDGIKVMPLPFPVPPPESVN